MADVKSAAQVALEAGNSPQMVFKHYRQLVTETQATEWFGILPPKDWKNIVAMPAETSMSQDFGTIDTAAAHALSFAPAKALAHAHMF
jgi:hypothetical protein